MTTSNAIEQTKEMTNGVDVGQIMDVIGAIEADPGYAKFQWRATNQWSEFLAGRGQSVFIALLAGKFPANDDAAFLEVPEPFREQRR